MKKRGIWIAAAVALVVLVAGGIIWATGGKSQPLTLDGNMENSKINKGFYAPSETGLLSGGQEAHGVTLQRAVARAEANETLLTLDLREGEEGDEALSMLPYVEIESYSNPARVIVWLEGIAFLSTPSIENQCLITSLFEVITHADTNRVGLVCQLSGPAALRVEYKNSALTLRLRAEGAASAGHYVVWYAMDQYKKGLPQAGSFGMSPMLSADALHQVLISTRFDTQDAAEVHKQAILAEVDGYYIETIQLEAGGIPAYNPEAEGELLGAQRLVLLNGQTPTLPVITANGALLAVSPDCTQRVFARKTTGEDRQYLCLLQADGSLSPLSNVAFFGLGQAVFSPDGRYLAFVEILEEFEDLRMLWLLDTQDGSLTNLSESGLGSISQGFDWSPDGTTLVAIAGEDEAYGGMGLRLFAWDPEAAATQAMEERRATPGDVAFAADGLYFTQLDDEDQSVLHRLNEDGTRQDFGPAVTLCASPSGRYLAYIQTDIGHEDTAFTLVLRDVEQNTQINLTQGPNPIVALRFAPDEDTLYYGVDENASEEFPFQMHRWSPAGQDSAVSYSPECWPVPYGNGSLTFGLPLEQNGVMCTVTYWLE